MPTTREVDCVVRATGSDLGGAGEPLGEPAPPPGILESVPDDLRRQLPDDVVDELLAGARTEEEIVGPGGLLSQLTRRLDLSSCAPERDAARRSRRPGSGCRPSEKLGAVGARRLSPRSSLSLTRSGL